MSLEENKAIVRRYIEEVVNNSDLSVAAELLAPDFVLYQGGRMTRSGPDGIRQSMAVGHARWADFKETIQEMIAEGDTVVVHSTRSGTHHGEYVSPLAGKIAPTGKKATWTQIFIYRLANGKIAEYRYLLDEAAILRQLGTIQ